MRWTTESCMSATRRRAKNAYARNDAHASWPGAGLGCAGLGWATESCSHACRATRRRAKNAYARSDAHTSCMAWGSARGGAGLQSHACRRRGDARNTRTRVAMRTPHACMARGSDEGLGWAGIHSRTEGVDARRRRARRRVTMRTRVHTQQQLGRRWATRLRHARGTTARTN